MQNIDCKLLCCSCLFFKARSIIITFSFWIYISKYSLNCSSIILYINIKLIDAIIDIVKSKYYFSLPGIYNQYSPLVWASLQKETDSTFCVYFTRKNVRYRRIYKLWNSFRILNMEQQSAISAINMYNIKVFFIFIK